MSDYGTMLQNQIEETLLESTNADLVFSYGAKLSKDGDQWCCLLGKNIQEGHATFGSSPREAVEQMRHYIYVGDKKPAQEGAESE